VSDGEERDVRDSLGELERRLLDLARELRTGASEDARIAAGAPAGPPPETGEATPPATPAPSVPPPAPPPEPDPDPAPAEPDPEIARLADEAQRKVEALRDSLDGLEHASDRLRETAQTVVEDHGRALVRLERAAAPRPTPPAPPPASPASPPPPAEPEPAPEPERAAPVVRAEPETALDPLHRARWVALGLGIALLLLVLGAALFAGGDEDDEPAPPPPGAFATRVLVAPGVPDLGLAEATAAAPAAALRAVCDGEAAAALVTYPASAPPDVPCRTAAVLADATLEVPAIAVPVPRGGGGRRCVSAAGVPALERARADERASASRAGAVRRAERDAAAGARDDGLPPPGIVRAARDAAVAAGTAFDRARRLRLLAISAEPGGTCVRPAGPGYPLGRRVALVASSDAAGSAEVERVEAGLRTALGGAPPARATVLRPR
jgi:hypothetical protein